MPLLARLSAANALLLGAILVSVMVTPPRLARAAEPPYHELWRDGPNSDFTGWTLHGARVHDGRIVLDTETAGALAGPAVEGIVLPDGPAGLALGPPRATSAPFTELIASWNAETPPDTWIEVRLRAQVGQRWTGWYELGAWSLEAGPERRQSVKNQRDDDGRVVTDTVSLTAPAQAYQLALLLRSEAASATPAVSLAAVLASTPAPAARELPVYRAAWGTVLDVPERSQMVYPGSGPVWCSPTSVSMVMAYWADRLDQPALNRPVPEVAAAVYDPVYRGNGNWSFNTAYAGRHGLLAYVSRMSALAQVERWIEAGVPVVASLAWSPGDLRNASVPSTNGHLLVIVGLTAGGDVVVNDPAADPRLGQSVQRVYDRAQFERLWLTHSGGTVYLIHPETLALPPSEAAFGAW